MDDTPVAPDTTTKLQSKLIGELNFELIRAERGELKLDINKILDNVMEIVYYKALDQGEKGIVNLDIARVYKRGYMAAQKCGYSGPEHRAALDFLLNGFQIHTGKYVKLQQKKLTETLDVS